MATPAFDLVSATSLKNIQSMGIIIPKTVKHNYHVETGHSY